MNKISKVRLFYVFLLFSAGAWGAPADEQVVHLPGYGTPPTKQYSGFLDASSAEAGTKLHYWYAESSNSPATAPVVLWLNGGPGSSSILGFLQEVGPLLINSTGLFENPYAWTLDANVIALESPAGVGYSYCSNSLAEGCANTDHSTAAAARAALQDFFRKFPELLPNKFYITGESYAGVYVPTLVQEILNNAPKINMVGMAVGDPCTDNDSQHVSMDMLWYAHKHGFVPDSEFDFLWNNCTARHPSFISQGSWKVAKGGKQLKQSQSKLGLSSPACVLANRKFLMSTSHGISQEWSEAWINDLTLYGPSAVVNFNQPGSLNYELAQYMMRPDVKAALHVTESPNPVWPGPQDHWSYTSDYAACNGNAKPGTPSMIDVYRDIAPRLQTTNVFNGDTDPCVSYEGTRTAIERVGFAVVDGGEYRPWFYNGSKAALRTLQEKPLLFGPDLALQDAGAQFGGHIVNYAHNLNFLTIHGSGHMVPQFRPQAALHMLRKVLGKASFSPLLVPDSALAAMTDADYESYLLNWTSSAKGAPYVE